MATEKNQSADFEYHRSMLALKIINRVDDTPKKFGSGRLTKAEKDSLEKMISEHNIKLVSGAKKEITVSFTHDGFMRFLRTPENRPELERKNFRESGTRRILVTFNCPKDQAVEYFLSFGKDAIITSPPKLSREMLKYHQVMVSGYAQTCIKNRPISNVQVSKDIETLINSLDKKATWNQLAIKYFKKSMEEMDYGAEYLFYQKSADLGIDNAYGHLADLYFESEFMQPDYKKAAYYYERAESELSKAQIVRYINLINSGYGTKHTQKEIDALLKETKDPKHKQHIEYEIGNGYQFQAYEHGLYQETSINLYADSSGEPLGGPFDLIFSLSSSKKKDGI